MVYGFERKGRLGCDIAWVLKGRFRSFAWGGGGWRGDLFHNRDISTPIPFVSSRCVFGKFGVNQRCISIVFPSQILFSVGEIVPTAEKNTEALVVAIKEIDLAVNADKTEYTVMSRDQNAGRSRNIKTENSSFERVEEFKYLRTTLKNENVILEGIKSRLKSGNVCYHSAQDLLSSSLLSKKKNLKIYRTIILLFVLYGCETLWEQRRVRVFENGVLRKIFGPKSDEVPEEWRK